MNKIKIKCKGSSTRSIEELQGFQGNLKTLPKKQEEKLRLSILSAGIISPIFVWGNKILDGHQRLYVLKKLIDKGYEVDNLPVVDVEASTEKEASEFILRYASMYGKINRKGLVELIESREINLSQIKMEIDLPELNLDSYGVQKEQIQGWETLYKLEVECASEEILKELYNELKEKGFKCRVLIF